MDPSTVLSQYGVIGLCLLFAAAAIRLLFEREIKAHQREQERADRLEQEVRRLNELIQEKMLPVLHNATQAISDALHEQRRRHIS